MKCNVGVVDRIARALIGIIAGSGGLMLNAPIFRWPLLLVGVTLLASAAFAWCPMYYMTGWSTDSKAV